MTPSVFIDADRRSRFGGGKSVSDKFARRALPVVAVMLGLLLVPVARAADTSNPAPGPRTTAVSAPAALTRGAIVKIVRHEIQRAFKLRNWHRFSSYIDEYKGADVDALFSLSTLDHATAIGNPESAVRVIVYADYECPYCKRFETETSATLHKRFRDNALFLFRFFPLEIHGKIARTEAIAGACIARIAGPDAFRQFTSRMYAEAGGNDVDRKTARLADIAEAILDSSHVKLDKKTLQQYYHNCTSGKTGAALIAPDAGFQGVTGTPTIFVVNTARKKAWRLAGAVPTWVFEALINNVMANQPGNSDWAVKKEQVSVPGI